MAMPQKLLNGLADLGMEKMQDYLDHYSDMVNKGEKSFSEALSELVSIEKENNFESVYKYQDIITGIEVTLENGNKVFKDNNNNIFPCLNNETLVHPSNGYAFPIYVDDKSNSEKKDLLKNLHEI